MVTKYIRCGTDIERELHHELKILAAKKDTTLSLLIESILVEYVERLNRKEEKK